MKERLSPQLRAFAFVLGIGFALIVTGLGAGAAMDGQIPTATVKLMLYAGLLIFVIGFGLWLGLGRPMDRFDDINIPADTGEHHDH